MSRTIGRTPRSHRVGEQLVPALVQHRLAEALRQQHEAALAGGLIDHAPEQIVVDQLLRTPRGRHRAHHAGEVAHGGELDRELNRELDLGALLGERAGG